MPSRDIFDPVALEILAQSHFKSHRAPRNADRPPPKVHFPPPGCEAEEIVPKGIKPRHLEVKVTVNNDNNDNDLSTSGPAPAVGDAREAGQLPTPPMTSSDSTQSAWNDQMNGHVGMNHEHQTDSNSSVGTPLHSPRPPTPDITPPAGLPKLSPLQLSADHRVPPPSSRTDSFRTAREDPYSSDGDGEGREEPTMSMMDADGSEDQSPTPLARDSRVAVTSAALMAAIEQNLNEQTPTRGMPAREFEAFDGAWETGARPETERNSHELGGGKVRSTTEEQKVKQPSKAHHQENHGQDDEQKHHHNEAEMSNDQQPDTSMQKVTKRRRARKRGNKGVTTATSEDERAPAPAPTTQPHLPLRRNTNKGPSLRERIEQNREAERRSSTREFAEKICWPLSGEGIPAESTEGGAHYMSDGRPVSMTSNASSIVQALVLAEPPPTPRRLRHAGKNIAWTKPMQDKSLTSSSISPSAHHQPHVRLVHQPAIDDMKRASLASERSNSPVQSHRHVPDPTPIPETIPAVVIPDPVRTSSKLPLPILKHEKSQEDIRRALRPDQQRSQSRREVRVDVSPSSSSSSDTVRTDQAQYGGPAVNKNYRPAARKQTMWMDDSPVKDISPSRDRNEAVRSYLAAGFASGSQLSNMSTPEALEVNEATAVSIYPHNNHSLLVVRQSSRPASQIQRLALPSNSATTPNRTSRDRDEEEEVVNNIPPTFQVIPPTPSIMSPIDETNRQLGATKPSHNERTRSGGVAMSLVKRALGNKRYGEGFVSPFARFHHDGHRQRGIDEATQTSNNSGHHLMSRRHALLSPRKDNVNNARDTSTTTNLSPFWRPRGFWDDFDDPSSSNPVDKDLTAKMQDEFLERGRLEEFDLQQHHQRQRHQRSRSGSASSSRSTSRDATGGYDGAAPISRGSENSKSNSTSNNDAAEGEAEGGSKRRAPRRRRVYFIKSLGVQVEFVGRKGIQERQRERDRGMIKRRISSPTMNMRGGGEYSEGV